MISQAKFIGHLMRRTFEIIHIFKSEIRKEISFDNKSNFRQRIVIVYFTFLIIVSNKLKFVVLQSDLSDIRIYTTATRRQNEDNRILFVALFAGALAAHLLPAGIGTEEIVAISERNQ